MSIVTKSALPVMASAIFIGACSDATDPGTDPPPNGGSGREVVADPSFAQIIQPIFDRKGCTASNCHGSLQSAGLDLRSGNSHASLVNEPASNEAGEIRVIPGDATNSYLMVKLEGRQNVGSQMPIGGSMDDIDLGNLRNWINQGAKNN